MTFRWLAYLIIICTLSVLTIAFIPGPMPDDEIVIINKGSLANLSKDLKRDGQIRSSSVFFLLAKGFNFFKVLRAGEYDIEARSSIIDILRTLQSGKCIQRAISIPEGYTTIQILELVEQEAHLSGAINRDEYSEGSLLPETYFFIHGETRKDLLKRMSDAMQRALYMTWRETTDRATLSSPQELAILASLVEKEAKLDSERPLIAAVFINRLKKKMRLESDPTTIYAITNGKYALTRGLTKKDLKSDSPFNTYANYGLPPTPIANPGIQSIRAAASPLETDHLYFVVKDCAGAHNFSKDIKTHNSNVRLYRKLICQDQ